MKANYPPILGIPYKWVATVIVMIGTFMTLLDTTIVDITLPKMLASLNTDTYGIQWVVISYMIGSAIAMTVVGWIGATFSYRIVYLLGFTIFVVSSAICGQARNLEMMIIARSIQGIGEGLVVPIAMTYLFLVFPKEEVGLAMGIYGLGASFAPALGPTLGGFITEHLSWRWIFYVNLPVGFIGLSAAILFLKKIKPEDEKPWPFDWFGFVMLAVSLSSLITFLSKGQEKGWLQSNMILILIIIFVISSIIFIVWEWYQKHPVVNVHLFKKRAFWVSVVALACFSLTLYGIYFLLPLYMERLRGYPTLTSGLILFPGSIAMGISLIIGGVLTNKLNLKWFAIFFIIIFSIFSYRFGYIDLYTSKSHIIALFTLWGISVGPLFPILTTGGLSSLSELDVNMGSAIQNVSRLVAGSVGTSIATTIIERKASYFYLIYSRHTDPSHVPFITSLNKTIKGFLLKGYTLKDAKILSYSLMKFYIKAEAYFTAFQSTFKIMAILALIALPVLLFFKTGKTKEKVPLH